MESNETNLNTHINIEPNNQNLEEENIEIRSYSIWEIEEFLKNNQLPPGIKTYEDMPPEIAIKPSENKITKAKKPWETQENIEHFKNLFSEKESTNKIVPNEINSIENLNNA
jgi:hypothetical protein